MTSSVKKNINLDLVALNNTSSLNANLSHTANICRIAVAVGVISTISSAYAKAPKIQVPQNTRNQPVVMQPTNHQYTHRKARDLESALFNTVNNWKILWVHTIPQHINHLTCVNVNHDPQKAGRYSYWIAY